MRFEFEVPGAPQGKGRARVTTQGGFARAYTPAKTANYENLVCLAWNERYGNITPCECPVEVWITAYHPIPKSTSKVMQKRMLAGEVVPAKKPDADNIAKVIADPIRGLAYRDDTQIVRMHIAKLYAERPRVEVVIEELDTCKGG